MWCLHQSTGERFLQREKRRYKRDNKDSLYLERVDIIEGEVCTDHIHLLLSIPPKLSVSSFMGYLKGKSSLMIFQKYGNMKYAYRNTRILV